MSEAYLVYWDAYADALLNLDPALARPAAAGAELERIEQEIEMLRNDGVALRIVAEHNFVVVSASDEKATVYDEWVNNSFFVDPSTKEPPEAPGSGDTIRDSFFLERIAGLWIVVGSARQRKAES